MRVVFWWVVFSLTFMILSFVLVYKKYKKKTPSDEKELNNEDMEEAIAEFMKLEIMRRLAQGSV
jgi:regulatory protein YycI of two-component signal transduction system YycFG